MTAAPVPINPVKLTSASPLDDPNATPPVTDKPDFTLARVTVANPVQGPNPIVVSANSEGTLQWSDPKTINAGLIVPGRYGLRAEMPTRSGWVAATGVLLCAFAKPCEFVVSPVSPDGGFVLRRLPRLTNTSTGGLVTGLALPNGAVTDFTKISVTGANIAFTGSNVNQGPFLVTGRITARDNSLDIADFVQPGTYQFTVRLNGYEQSVINVSCGPDFRATAPAGCGPFNVALTRLPAFVSTTVQLDPPTTPTDPIVPIDRDKVQVSVRDHPRRSRSTSTPTARSPGPTKPNWPG